MRLDYFRLHRQCFYLAVCGCDPQCTRYCDRKPFAATRHAAAHARSHPGHTSWVFDMKCLNTVSRHHYTSLPGNFDQPPF